MLANTDDFLVALDKMQVYTQIIIGFIHVYV